MVIYCKSIGILSIGRTGCWHSLITLQPAFKSREWEQINNDCLKCRCLGSSFKIGTHKWIVNLWKWGCKRSVVHFGWQIESRGTPKNRLPGTTVNLSTVLGHLIPTEMWHTLTLSFLLLLIAVIWCAVTMENLTELLTVAIPQWASDFRIGDDEKNIQMNCSTHRVMISIAAETRQNGISWWHAYGQF